MEVLKFSEIFQIFVLVQGTWNANLCQIWFSAELNFVAQASCTMCLLCLTCSKWFVISSQNGVGAAVFPYTSPGVHTLDQLFQSIGAQLYCLSVCLLVCLGTYHLFLFILFPFFSLHVVVLVLCAVCCVFVLHVVVLVLCVCPPCCSPCVCFSWTKVMF